MVDQFDEIEDREQVHFNGGQRVAHEILMICILDALRDHGIDVDTILRKAEHLVDEKTLISERDYLTARLLRARQDGIELTLRGVTDSYDRLLEIEVEDNLS